LDQLARHYGDPGGIIDQAHERPLISIVDEELTKVPMRKLRSRPMRRSEARQIEAWQALYWTPPWPCPHCGSRERAIPPRVLVTTQAVPVFQIRWIVVVCADCGLREVRTMNELNIA
jgi:predicted nucleic-acid-binding Zn-ribbon protein